MSPGSSAARYVRPGGPAQGLRTQRSPRLAQGPGWRCRAADTIIASTRHGDTVGCAGAGLGAKGTCRVLSQQQQPALGVPSRQHVCWSSGSSSVAPGPAAKLPKAGYGGRVLVWVGGSRGETQQPAPAPHRLLAHTPVCTLDSIKKEIRRRLPGGEYVCAAHRATGHAVAAT